MSRGPKPTTRRGRAAGARELRAWLSADEYARWEAAAKAAGFKLGDYVRSLTPPGMSTGRQELAHPRIGE